MREFLVVFNLADEVMGFRANGVCPVERVGYVDDLAVGCGSAVGLAGRPTGVQHGFEHGGGGPHPSLADRDVFTGGPPLLNVTKVCDNRKIDQFINSGKTGTYSKLVRIS